MLSAFHCVIDVNIPTLVFYLLLFHYVPLIIECQIPHLNVEMNNIAVSIMKHFLFSNTVRMFEHCSLANLFVCPMCVNSLLFDVFLHVLNTVAVY